MRGTARRDRWELLASVVATFVNSMHGSITLKATLLSTGAVSSERRPECSRAPTMPHTKNSLSVAPTVACRTPLLRLLLHSCPAQLTA